MKNRVLLTTVIAGVVLTGPARAWAAPEKRETRGRLVQRVTDAATGAEFRVYRAGPSDVTVTVNDKHVTITKHFTSTASTTSVVTGKERVSLRVDFGGVTFTNGAKRLNAPRGAVRAGELMRDALQRSSAIAEAAALLGRVSVTPTTPAAFLVLTTRASLLAARGDRAGLAELAAQVQVRPAVRVGLTPVGYQDGPSHCWDEYAREAIAAYMEYEDCLKDVRWWQIGAELACGVVYDMRALGAFSWWVKCVGFNI